MGKVVLGLLDEVAGFISQTAGGLLNMGALHGKQVPEFGTSDLEGAAADMTTGPKIYLEVLKWMEMGNLLVETAIIKRVVGFLAISSYIKLIQSRYVQNRHSGRNVSLSAAKEMRTLLTLIHSLGISPFLREKLVQRLRELEKQSA